MESIIWLKDITRHDLSKVGNKAVELSDLMRKNIPIPPGFVVSSFAFRNFLERNSIGKKMLGKIKNLSAEDKNSIEEVSSSIQNLILGSSIDGITRDDILEAYDNLNINAELFKEINKEALSIIRAGKEFPFVLLRASFIENLSSSDVNLFNIKGNSNLIEHIKKCWARSFTSETISKVIEDNIDFENILISIIVQKQVQSNKSGTISSAENEFLLEAGLGLSEPIMTSRINPDLYKVEKNKLEIIDKKINKQEFYNMLDVNLGKIIQRSLSEINKNSQKLSDYEIIKLAEISKKVEEVYNEPRDIEFAVEGASIFVIQTKPLGSFRKPVHEEAEKIEPAKAKDDGFENVPLID